jgi:hypothetical protein
MTDPRRLLEEARNLGNQELDFLKKGDVDSASDLAGQRQELMQRAFDVLDDSTRNSCADQLRELHEQLDAIMAEGRKLKSSLQADLGKVRNTGKQFKGYSMGAGIPQGNRGLYHKRG